MENNIPWQIINEFLDNDQSEMDVRLISWLEESSEHQVIFDEIRVLHGLTGELPHTFYPNKEVAWQKIEKNITQKVPVKSMLPFLRRIAAAFALVLTGYSISMIIDFSEDSSFTKVQSAKGNKALVYLPDSSTVYLNGGSSIVYYTDFIKRRHVELRGEALFDVKKDAGNQFIVQTGDLDVKVLGTRFNAKAFEDDAETEISLLEGSIGLSGNNKEILTLSPGEIAIYDRTTGKLIRKTGDVSKVIAWSHDELIFDDNTFEDIVTYLERWYGVEIELDDALKNKHRFTFSIKTESLREMLDLMNVLLPLKYEIDGKSVKIMKNTNSGTKRSVPMR